MTADIGRAVTGWRERRRLSQADLADRVGCAHSAISRIERGERGVSRTMALAICDALHLDAFETESLLNLCGYTSVVWSRVAWDVQRAVDGRDVAA